MVGVWKEGGLYMALETLWTSCFISSLLFHVGYINKPFSTCAQLAVWLYSHCQGHHKVICFPLHCTSHVRRLKFKDALQKKTRIECLFKRLRRSVQTVRSESLGVIHSPLCSAHTHRHCSWRPLGRGVLSPQTERTSWLRPAPALPEELRPKPLRGRGGARPTEPRTNERSAHPPLQGWLITRTHSSPLKECSLNKRS